MRIQLWSYNYDPEPQGIAPLSGMLARSLSALGHEILVVAAHPHYPTADWGRRLRPYRERRDGISILRLPLWIGRDGGKERLRQELSFAAAQSALAPLLPACDAMIAVTPCFPALLPAMVTARARRVPWVIWLQDIVTDGAVTTGLLDGASPALRVARHLEKASYEAADRVVVISEAFRSNLAGKGVEASQMVRIFNPSSREAAQPNDVGALQARSPEILAMGNVGHSQGLDRVVDAFQANTALREMDARLVVAGWGVAAPDVERRIRSTAVVMRGVLHGADLEPVLRGASLGLVSQRADIAEFNLPSKLMNYMAYGIPVLASVSTGSETARIVEESGAGWVTDARDPGAFAEKAAEVLRDERALTAAGNAGYRFAREHFAPSSVAEQFDALLAELCGLPARA